MNTESAASDPLWVPSSERIATSQIDRFRRANVADSTSTDDLWRWSVEEPGAFWRAMYQWAGIVGDPGPRDLDHGDAFYRTRFLPDATLNFAENLLAERTGATEPAIIALAEPPTDRSAVPTDRDLTWDELRSEVAAMAAALRSFGVEAGDRVAAWMPHRTETIVAFLAAASIGAVFTSTSADFGVDGVVDRFGQTEPKVLLAADGYRYGGREFHLLDRLGEITSALPSVEQVLVVGCLTEAPDLTSVRSAAEDRPVHNWDELMAAHRGAALSFEPLPADHPIYILYSSGTTGKPKCIVHHAGGVLLKHLCEQRLHSDIGPGDRVFFFTTCGWMMWNWLVSCLGAGASIVLYDGNPAQPSMATLFEVAEEHSVTLFGVSAKFIDGVMKSGYRPADHHDLSSVRTVCSTGSPLSHEGFAWVYDALSPDVHLASISGGTDLCGCLVLGDPTKPVYAGEIQTKALGLDIEVFNTDGVPVPPGVKGDLVCRNPFPSMPIEFWSDPGDLRYRKAYFETYPNVWAHGDYASWTENGGMVIHGRSDATLNASGVRIGTAEIYRVVEQIPEVMEAIAVGQQWDGDTRIVLFVRLAEGATLDDDLQRTIKVELRTKCSPRHVPAVVASVTDIPRTRSGKIVEMAVTDIIHGREIGNLEALANPEALEQFAGRSELG